MEEISVSATTTPGTYKSDATDYDYVGAGSVFGGTVLITVGLFQLFEGLAAVLKDEVYATTRNYVYKFDLTTWGWLHLTIGAVAVAVGIAILIGQRWALFAGIGMATLSALSQFLFLPWQPLWAMLIIGIDIAIVWALALRLSDR
jgi:putative Mn2+ efflux pump MntP